MDSIIDSIKFMFLVFALVLIGLSIDFYYTEGVMNQVKAEVFNQITDNTTNKEITGYIHDSCSKTPWYVSETDCESVLLNKFITPTK